LPKLTAASSPRSYCSRLNGLTTRNRPPVSVGTLRLNVTRPMTVPSFILSPPALFVHDGDNHPAHGTFVIPDGFARCQAVGRNNHLLVHARAVRVYGTVGEPSGSPAVLIGWQ